MMAETFAALAEPNRFRIVELLRDGPRAVGEIGARLELQQPHVSKHLRVLKAAGLVDVEARAQHRLYGLRAAPFVDLSDWLERYRALWDERFDALSEVLQGMQQAQAQAATTAKRKKPKTTKGRAP